MKFSAPKGTKDILPKSIRVWQQIEEVAKEVFSLYGYKEIRTPIFEEASLFERSIGEHTEIVTKQMYKFFDKKGRELVLRPENTASIVRACIEHGLLTENETLKLYYIGPMFRYERPQQGRMRQFWQMGTEALGCKDATLDAETIQMVSHFCKKLGIKDVRILLNSIGCKECKQDYIRRLLSFLEEKKPPLCTQCRGRKNPLRVLDCKVCSKKMKDAPFPTQTLCNACMQHFEEVKDYLHLFGVMYEIQPHLVRGLDYYTRTCFEVIDPRLGAKNAIAAGGRYDDLVQELGGPPTPCFGFAAGVERIILSLKQREILFTEDECTVYLAPAGGVTNKEIASLLQRLRKDGVKCICDWEKLSLRSHLRLAQKMQVDYVIIVGEEELQKEVFALRCMKEGEQFLVSYEELLKKIAHV